MAPESARLNVAGTRFADVRWHGEVGSTNQVATALAADGVPEGVVVVADSQTDGRGRRGRSWYAPPRSSLLLSVLLRPDLPATHVPLTTVAMALAAAKGCQDVADVAPLLRWPNDLVVRGRKLGGILAEAVQDAVIVGLGVNVNWEHEVPPDSGVALDSLVGAPVDRSHLLTSILRHLESVYGHLGEPGGPTRMLEDYRSRSATLGQRVRVELPNGRVVGEAVDVTAEGHLVVDESGRRHVMTAGDVVHLRSA
jgi:BirA family biotin operon repressor/biotin-[acetyl-CoA-carboxylase] ligase